MFRLENKTDKSAKRDLFITVAGNVGAGKSTLTKLVGEKLKACIRSKRVTKVNICKKAKISRPILEELLNGEIDNKSVFDEHLYKILDSLKITPDFLMKALPETQQPDEMCLQAVFENYQMSEKAMREYELLQDILNLCSIYY